MVIKTKDIENIFHRIIEKLNYENINEVEIDIDLYNYIPADEWTSFEYNSFEVGSLKDDIESLLLIANNSERPCTYVDFDRTASLLHAISLIKNPPM
ncbi:hypothetical protein [Chryseobacterium nepalense]|uniref:hypothetical protein n=1 Tax=Chryseobacterium nepalense TaxID=1854498 RepID=UPI002E0B538A|nr:hypothetical protein [Chryseobacterium nepalense]